MPAAEAGAEPDGRRRPTLDDMDDVFAAVASGQSVRAHCMANGIDPQSTYKFIYADAALASAYEAAREERGDHYGFKVGEVAQDVLDQKILPDVGRVAMDGFKWTSARMATKRWGDRQEINHTGIAILTPEERKAQIAALEAELLAEAKGSNGSDGGEGA